MNTSFCFQFSIQNLKHVLFNFFFFQYQIAIISKEKGVEIRDNLEVKGHWDFAINPGPPQ